MYQSVYRSVRLSFLLADGFLLTVAEVVVPLVSPDGEDLYTVLLRPVVRLTISPVHIAVQEGKQYTLTCINN